MAQEVVIAVDPEAVMAVARGEAVVQEEVEEEEVS
jgi:hypothetical protein